jgi:glycosyltransferase involved in cell wall biosynthesis
MYSSHFTGIGRYVFELVENLQQIDRANEYFLFFNQPEFNNFQAGSPNFHKVLVDVRHYSLAEQTRFKKTLDLYRLDLMHFTHFNAPIFYRRPSIVTIHDLTLHFFPGKKMNSPLHRLAYALTVRSAVKKAARIIAVSRSTARDLDEVLHVPLSRIKIIYEGVNPDFHPVTNQQVLANTLEKYGINKPFLLYTGVWRNHKNLEGLLRAFALLGRHQDLQLVITGRKDSVYAEGIFDLATQLGLMEPFPGGKAPRVIFPGLVGEDELIHLLNAAHIYVFPSLYEGFGLPPLEAMQCGTPVVASNSSSIPEICGNNAVYFDPRSPEDMAAAIEKLLSDPVLYQKLVASGLEHVKKFSWAKMARETHDLYLHALSPPRQ